MLSKYALFIYLCIAGSSNVPTRRTHQEDQSWLTGKYVPPQEIRQRYWTLQEDHYQPCSQEEALLFGLVDFLSVLLADFFVYIT